jgi:hypothetical protein
MTWPPQSPKIETIYKSSKSINPIDVAIRNTVVVGGTGSSGRRTPFFTIKKTPELCCPFLFITTGM